MERILILLSTGFGLLVSVLLLGLPILTIVALFQKLEWRKNIKTEAKNRLQNKQHWFKFVWMFVVIVFVGLALNYVLGLDIVSRIPFGGIIKIFLPLMYTGLVSNGMVQVMTRIKRQLDFEFADFFDTSNLSRILTLTFIQNVYLFFWGLLFVIPALIKGYSYSQTYYILYHQPELSTDEIIKRSREMMQGHKWELFVLDASFIGWAFLGIFTLGIAGFYIAPLYFMARLGFYEYVQNGYVKSSQHQNVYNIYA